MLNEPILGAFEAPPPGEHILGPDEKIDVPMRHYPHNEAVDFCIVGIGASGGVLLQRLARAGFSVVGFDAGPFWDTERDWVSDEVASHNLYWNDLRITGGEDPVALGSNNSGKGVGGGTVHWSAFTPRLHPSDFRVYSEDGVGVDWPISYEDIRPYYELMEWELPVAGPAYFPWGYPHGYPYAPHPTGGVADLFIKGCTRLGIEVVAGGPVAITSGSHGDRPHCIYRGFCLQGCKVGAKQSTLVSHVPDGIRCGAEIRDRCMVGRINMKDGLVRSVTYFDSTGKEQEQRAKVIIVCGYAIETPRLLLNSACPGFENGLANSSDTLGRYLMVQSGNVSLARFADLIRMYKAPPANAATEAFYETNPANDFVRGYAIQTVSPLPVGFAKEMMIAKGSWGWGLRRDLMNYNHWAGLGLLGEILPDKDNRVQVIPNLRDTHGLPIPQVTFAMHENDRKVMQAGVQKMREIWEAAGAEEIVEETRFAHLVGGARMGNDPATSVTDAFGCTHDIANLYIGDGSLFPTEGSANPGLTIQALAARLADYLISNASEVLSGKRGSNKHPPVRKNLSPPQSYGHGVPRLK